MKKASLFLVVFLIFGSLLKAAPDEGMWLPLYIKQLNMQQMEKLGLKLSADDIYDINHASLKDAVLRLGQGFCTGELVSDQGLVFTNHHCGYDAIASLSTVTNDFLTNGFWANSLEEEIPIPDFTVSRLVYMEEITHAVDSVVARVDNEDEIEKARNDYFDKLIEEKTNGTHYDGDVKTMFGGSEYYLMIYETFKDVRFVGAPPESIGKFGGDTDNWMWPRHTGDFSILRVYTGPDGKPAEYNEENVPYKPIKHFEISLDGVHNGDFAMIMGYPGRTERYLTSYDIDYKQNYENPALIDIFGDILANMKSAMDADPKVRLDLASDYAGLANFFKYTEGQNLGLQRFKLIEQYREKEAEMTKWISQDPARIEKYGDILDKYKDAYQKVYDIMPSFYYVVVGMRRLHLYNSLKSFNEINNSLNEGKKPDELKESLDQLKESVLADFDDGTMDREKKSLRTFMQAFYANLKDPSGIELFGYIDQNFEGKDMKAKINAFLDQVYASSLVFNKNKAEAYFAKPKKSAFKKDKVLDIYNMASSYIRDNYMSYVGGIGAVAALHQDYVSLLREWQKDKVFYPDANSTMRLTYGSVKPYFARDAVFYNYYTTFKGVLEKEIPGDEEFNVDPKLKQLFLDKDFGPYAENDTLRLCFLTNNDITGGNSGSPVIDANGRLIGIAFDGNWEAMTGDLVVDPVYNRTISVDIRYVLFVIDKFANAQNLINELDIVKTVVEKAEATVE